MRNDNIVLSNGKAIIMRFLQLVISSLLTSVLCVLGLKAHFLTTIWFFFYFLMLFALFVFYNARCMRYCCVEGLYLKNYYYSNIIAYGMFMGYTYALYYFIMVKMGMKMAYYYTSLVMYPLMYYGKSYFDFTLFQYQLIFHGIMILILLFVPVGIRGTLKYRQVTYEQSMKEEEERNS